jgi:hypothetical protein
MRPCGVRSGPGLAGLPAVPLRRRYGLSSCKRRRWPAAAGQRSAAFNNVLPQRAAQRKRGSRIVTWPKSVATTWSFTRQPPPQREQVGRRTAWSLTWAATISCWSVANTRFVSKSVRPRSAISEISSGRSISMTSRLRLSPSVPMLTCRKIQATLSPRSKTDLKMPAWRGDPKTCGSPPHSRCCGRNRCYRLNFQIEALLVDGAVLTLNP